MAHLNTITIHCLFMFAYGITVSANEPTNVLSELVATVVIPGDAGAGCVSDEDRQDALELIQSRTELILQNYSFNPNCGPGIWRQVFYLNTSSQDQLCPDD